MRTTYLFTFCILLLFSCKKKNTPDSVPNNTGNQTGDTTIVANTIDSVNIASVICTTYFGKVHSYKTISVSPGYVIEDYPNCRLDITVANDTLLGTLTNLDSNYLFEITTFQRPLTDVPDTTTIFEFGTAAFSQCRMVELKFYTANDSIYYHLGKNCSFAMALLTFTGTKQ